MKIVNFKVNDKHKFGIIKDNGIVDASAIYGNKYPSLKTFLENEDIKGLKKLMPLALIIFSMKLNFYP